METDPSSLSEQLNGLRSNAWARRENRALLPAALHALIAAIFARIFARLELLLQAWQTGSLPPPPIKSQRNPMQHLPRPVTRAFRPRAIPAPKASPHPTRIVGRISEAPSDSPCQHPKNRPCPQPASRPRPARDPPRRPRIARYPGPPNRADYITISKLNPIRPATPRETGRAPHAAAGCAASSSPGLPSPATG